MGMIFVTLIRTIVRGVSRVQITFRHFVGFFFASMVLIRTISGRNLLWNNVLGYILNHKEWNTIYLCVHYK